MVARRKVWSAKTARHELLRTKVDGAQLTKANRNAVTKDLHLVEASLMADGIVISIDRSAHDSFSALASSVKQLKSIAWVDPTVDPERLQFLLRSGRELPREFRLG